MNLFKSKRRNKTHSTIVVGGGIHSSEAEGYNRLRDNILYLNADGKSKCIQIESSLAEEGKTTLACNLAVSLGLTDKKVCLVDLDFHRPKVHRMFDLSKENGIAECLKDDVKKEEIIKHTKYSNVDIVTRGAEISNSSLVLVSEKFKNLIETLKKEYDFVLLDCPPILQVSDFIHISKVADGIIFLAAYGKTTRTQVKAAIEEIKKNKINLLGTVMTMCDKNNSETGFYNYY